jgi:hypothetical protein
MACSKICVCYLFHDHKQPVIQPEKNVTACARSTIPRSKANSELELRLTGIEYNADNHSLWRTEA